MHNPAACLAALALLTFACGGGDSSAEGADTVAPVPDAATDAAMPETDAAAGDSGAADESAQDGAIGCGAAPCDDQDAATYDFCHQASGTCVHNDAAYPIGTHAVDGRMYHWLIGHDWDRWGEVGSLVTEPGPPWLTELVWGTDLGMSVRFGAARLFYFGDTWRFESGQSRLHRYCDPGCTDPSPAAGCAHCDDVMAVSHDDDPRDGMHWSEVPFRIEADGVRRFVPIALPGVHSDVRQSGIWGSAFNVPGGAVSFELDGAPQVLLWYVTAMLEGAGVRARSWLGRSHDGVAFESCFEPVSDEDRYLPFSGGAAGARFLNVAAVEIGEPRFEGCDLPPWASERGFLLIGAGTPYRKSDLRLAYAPLEQLCSRRCEADGCDHHWIAYYTGVAGACWSEAEADAAPLLGNIRTAAEVAGGVARSDTLGIGELSVKVVPGLGLVMLSNETWCARAEGCTAAEHFTRSVVLRRAPAARPWAWSPPVDTGATGYGPYMLDGHLRWDAGARTLRIWHLGSTWKGSGVTETPYGVQLSEIEVVLP